MFQRYSCSVHDDAFDISENDFAEILKQTDNRSDVSGDPERCPHFPA